MKVNINIIEKLKEESCTFYVHKVTSFIQDMVSTLENSSDDYLIVNSIHKNEQEKSLVQLFIIWNTLKEKCLFIQKKIYLR